MIKAIRIVMLLVVILLSFNFVLAAGYTGTWETTPTTNVNAANYGEGYGYFVWRALLPVLTLLFAIVLIALLIKYSGMGEVLINIQHFFGNVFNFLRGIFEGLINSAPGFIKIIFFILLFAVFAPIIYNLSFGITTVCAQNGDVYRGDVFSSIIYTLLPNKDYGGSGGEAIPVTNIEPILTLYQFPVAGAQIVGFQKTAADGEYYLIPKDYVKRYADENAGLFGAGGYPFCIWYNSEDNVNEISIAKSANCIWRFKYIAVENGNVYSPKLMVERGYSKLTWAWNKATEVAESSTSEKICIWEDCFNVENTFYRRLDIVRENHFLFWTWGPNFLTPGIPRVIVNYDSFMSGKSTTSEGSNRDGGSSEVCSAATPQYCDENQLLGQDISTDRVYFMENFFEKIQNSTDNRKNTLISYRCNLCESGNDISEEPDCKRKDDEELLIEGIPVFDMKIIMAIVVATILFMVIGFFKKR